MKSSQIKGKRVLLHFSDNSKDEKQSKLFVKYLKQSLPALENFIFSKNLIIAKKKVSQVEVSLSLCGNAKIRSLNKEYRGKDYATDVLSFQLHDSLRTDEDFFFFDKILNLGDIIISREVAKKQAREFEITYEQELLHLFVHGLLHVLGYDHEISDAEEKIMNKFEEQIVAKIYKDIGF